MKSGLFNQGMAKVRAITTSLECKIANSGKDFVNMIMSLGCCFLSLQSIIIFDIFILNDNYISNH